MSVALSRPQRTLTLSERKEGPGDLVCGDSSRSGTRENDARLSRFLMIEFATAYEFTSSAVLF
jgi:hypothetical protein